ncbi:hypothetical protein BH18CHL2_BH18CHL2_03110 [soil metagenome]
MLPRAFRRPSDIGSAIDAVRKLPTYARLVWGLARDARVPATQKLVLAGVIGYLLMPLDLIPDFIPVLGQLDDVAVLLLGLDLFIRVAPKEVVDEHLARIERGRDDLTRDMAQVQSLLGDRFVSIRGSLDRILDRQRRRFTTADEAADALERWQDRGRDGPADREGRT